MSKITLPDKKYPAKLLLFGEYTALLGGDVLAMPLPQLYAEWAFGKKFPHLTLGNHLSAVFADFPNYQFNVDLWQSWLSSGGYLHSTVPNGYGLGSSGNLVAALFDAFVTKADNLDLAELKLILGKIESFFHGNSSGVDPLVSYLNRPLLFSQNTIHEVALPTDVPENLYLFDAQKPRNTEVLVKDFKKRMHEPVFADAMATLATLKPGSHPKLSFRHRCLCLFFSRDKQIPI